MHIGQAIFYFIILEFITIFAWFAVVVHIKNAMNLIVTGAAGIAPQSVAIGQNVVTGLNVVFLVLCILWACWLAYQAHLNVNETVYATVPSNQTRRW